MVEGPIEQATDRDLSKPLILIIEDDPAAAELMKRQLGGAGFRTVLSRTGGAGVLLARELQPAAVTIDIMLPDMDGWEVITLLKKDATTVGIPIMVVSVVDNPELGLALGTTDYLVKPVVATELIKKMNHMGVRNGGAAQRTVLVVDDEATHRNWLLAALEPAGYTVLQASSGREAIDLARKHTPNVILLDLMMPGLSGFDVIEALNLDEGTLKIPIVVISSAEPTGAEKKYLKERVSSILRRGSVGAADLLGLLRATIEQPGR